MKRYRLYILVSLVFVLVVTVFVACSYVAGPLLIPTSTLLPTQPALTTQPAGNDDQKVYPASPEAVVQAFLLALQADPSLALRYLSSAAKSNLPAGGPVDLLAVTGIVQGTAIQSGAVSMDPPAAQVEVGLLVQTDPKVPGKNHIRRFNLIKENDHWVISSIDAKD